MTFTVLRGSSKEILRKRKVGKQANWPFHTEVWLVCSKEGTVNFTSACVCEEVWKRYLSSKPPLKMGLIGPLRVSIKAALTSFQICSPVANADLREIMSSSHDQEWSDVSFFFLHKVPRSQSTWLEAWDCKVWEEDQFKTISPEPCYPLGRKKVPVWNQCNLEEVGSCKGPK